MDIENPPTVAGDQASLSDHRRRAVAEGSASPLTSTTRPAGRSRRPFLILGGVLLLVIVAVAFYLVLTAGKESTDDAQVQSDVVPIGARVPGQVRRVAIRENQVVTKGDPIIELDDADYAAREKQVEAELETARAQAQAADAQVQVIEATSRGGLLSARAMVSGSSLGVSSAGAQVEAARASVLRAEADARRAELDLGRAKELRAANAVPQERLDNAQVAADSMRAQLAQAKAQLAAAEDAKRVAASRVSEARGRLDQSAPIDAQIATARANADLAHARMKSAAAQLDLAKLQLSYTRIVAPADGMASKLVVHEGQLVQQGQPLVELVPITTYVVANFKETQIGRMRPGQEAEVELDAYSGRKLRGKVESISGGTGATFSLLPADNASGNFVKVVQRVPVRIAWVDPPRDLLLRAGLYTQK